jgi:hypothetical protein
MKFNVSIFADGDFEYRVDGYMIEAQDMASIDFVDCIKEAQIKFPSFSGILVEEIA